MPAVSRASASRSRSAASSALCKRCSVTSAVVPTTRTTLPSSPGKALPFRRTHLTGPWTAPVRSSRSSSLQVWERSALRAGRSERSSGWKLLTKLPYVRLCTRDLVAPGTRSCTAMIPERVSSSQTAISEASMATWSRRRSRSISLPARYWGVRSSISPKIVRARPSGSRAAASVTRARQHSAVSGAVAPQARERPARPGQERLQLCD